MNIDIKNKTGSGVYSHQLGYFRVGDDAEPPVPNVTFGACKGRCDANASCAGFCFQDVVPKPEGKVAMCCKAAGTLCPRPVPKQAPQTNPIWPRRKEPPPPPRPSPRKSCPCIECHTLSAALLKCGAWLARFARLLWRFGSHADAPQTPSTRCTLTRWTSRTRTTAPAPPPRATARTTSTAPPATFTTPGRRCWPTSARPCRSRLAQPRCHGPGRGRTSHVLARFHLAWDGDSLPLALSRPVRTAMYCTTCSGG